MGVDVNYNCDCCGGGCCRDKVILCRSCLDNYEEKIAELHERITELEEQIEEMENAD